MKSGRPCHASRGHSIILTLSMSGLQDAGFELTDFRVEGCGFEGLDQRFARVGWIDYGVDPKAGSSIAGIGLMLVCGAYGFVQFLFGFLVDFLTFALELF